MELLHVLYGIIFGIFLTIGDGIAIQHRARAGFKRSILTWVALVAAPIVVSLVVAWPITLVALVVSTVLSALMAWQSRKGQGWAVGNRD